MLTSAMIKKFKKRLEEKKEEVTKELLSFASKSNPSTGNFDTVFPKYGEHLDENAQEINTYEDTLPVEYALEKDLDEIRKSLQRIEEGTYGVCENCGKQIDTKRLEAYPEAERCVSCATTSK